MRRTITIFFLLICAFVIFTINASAQVFIEDFNYTPGTFLTANGWAAHSGAGTLQETVTATGLTYTGYASSDVGYASTLDSTGQDINKTWTSYPNGTTSGDLYFSVLVNLSTAKTAGDYFFHLFKNSSTFPARVFAKKAFTSNNFSFGIMKGSTAANLAWSDSIYSFGTTYLLVVKYSMLAGATNDSVALWINPVISATEPAPTVLQTSADRATADVDTVYGIAIRQGSAANTPKGTIDGIRVGTTWNNSVNGVLEPKVAIAPASIDFGKVNVGASATDTITLQNKSAYATMNITSVSSSDVAFVVTPTTATILPLASQKFAVTYTPAGAVPSSANIVFVSNDPTSPNTVPVSGSGTQAGFSMTPTSLNFGNTFKDATKTDSIAIANASETAHLVIDSVKSDNTLFTITPTSADLDTSSTTKFAVTFSPIAKGAATGKIVFYHNAPSKQDTLTVQGNGILKEPLFSVAPTTMNLGLVVLGNSKTDSLVVTNIGYDSLIISNVVPSDPSYTITPTTARLDIMASQKFFITFNPSAIGSIPASIVFTSNVSEVTDTVKVTGTVTSAVPISEARKDLDGDYIADHVATGDTLVCVGIITTPNMGASAGQTSYFIQDSTGGIDVFAFGVSSTTYAIGDSVRAIGIVNQYRGLVELTLLALDDAHFTVLKHNASVPAPKKLSLHQFVTNAENYEGQLIELDGLSKASGTWPASASNTSIFVMNASKADTMQMFLDLDANITMAEPIYPINVVGFVSQYTSSTPPNNGYEICPRDTNDITTPPPPLIVVDGLKDDLYGTLTGPADGYLQIKNYAANDNGTARNNADLSAKVWTAWDPTWFYLYTEVMDDTVCGNAPNVYQEDGMELKFDPQPKDSVANSIYAVGITALGMGSPGVVKADSLGNIPDSLKQKQWARRIIPGGYALEIAMKWSAIGTTEKVSVAKDSVFGLAVNFHDNDSSKTRVASIEWAAVMLDAVWNTPKYLGTVKFLADNKLSFIPKNNMTGRTNPIPYDGTPFYINVDGTKDYIYNSLTGPQDGYLQMRSYAWNDNGKPTNDADLSAKVWAVWDTTWFYMYTEVKDDTVCGNAPQVYQEDGMELKFDCQPKDSVRNTIWPVGITALGMGSPGVVRADSLTPVPDSLKHWVRRIIPGGYALEIAMKWSAIGTTEKVSVAKDSLFGLAVCFHDNDSSKARVASIEWAAVMLDAVWNTPKYLGTVKFLEDNKLQFIPTNNMTPWRTNPIPYDGSNYIRTGVSQAQSTIPNTYSLAQNYPNPFNPSTTIEYTLPIRSNVTIKIYSILGQEVATLINNEQSAGYYQTVWNASRLASGMYFLRISAQSVDGTQPSFTQVKKMLLMK